MSTGLVSFARALPLLSFVVAFAALAGCGGDAPPVAPVAAEACQVHLHGKGSRGMPPRLSEGIAVLSPEGNGKGWGGRQWLYEEPEDLRSALESIRSGIDSTGCQTVVIRGFSNGGAMAAKLYCSGVDLDGRLVGYVIDDPVTDLSSAGCEPAPEVLVALYWTGALSEIAPAGTGCATVDWTCEGSIVRSIDDFAAALGTTVIASPKDEHEPFDGAPELVDWLNRAS